MANTRRDFLQQAATVAVGSYVGIHSSPAVPMLSAAEPPAVDETPELAALRIVELSEEHIAAVKRRRRIYVNNDAGYGAPMGPTISAITPAEWIEARFSAFTQSGSQGRVSMGFSCSIFFPRARNPASATLARQ